MTFSRLNIFGADFVYCLIGAKAVLENTSSGLHLSVRDKYLNPR